jgi:murein DD-endopeptidase MepM/ murein hydrolase activator NlpD
METYPRKFLIQALHHAVTRFPYSLRRLIKNFGLFLAGWGRFFSIRLVKLLRRLDLGKSLFAQRLYRQRGKLARPFSHAGMAILAIAGIGLAPVVVETYPGLLSDPWVGDSPSSVLLAAGIGDDDMQVATLISEKPRDQVIQYVVQPGDTVSSIAKKFDISIDSIRWQNDLKSIDSIKPGQTLEILPVTGILHKVKKGDTVYSIAKKYDTGPQAIVDFPFNTFSNDETFALAIGQQLIVPDGVLPSIRPWSPTRYVVQKTPDAGTVVASGQFVWPAGGSITQRYRWYHPGIDIANRSAPGIAAADAGTVVTAGWPDSGGYGNRILIDHGNGFSTLYAHLSRVYVTRGQTVSRGAIIGQMGSTGRSTGIHLHFEIRHNGASKNPLGYLK